MSPIEFPTRNCVLAMCVGLHICSLRTSSHRENADARQTEIQYALLGIFVCNFTTQLRELSGAYIYIVNKVNYGRYS